MLTFLPVLVAQAPPPARPPQVKPTPAPRPPRPPLAVPPVEVIPSQPILPPNLSPSPQEIMVPQEVRPLMGRLDDIPVFNSNSPEVVQFPGILLSSFPPQDKQTPAAHLDFAFQGRFDIFTHHVSRIREDRDASSLFQGILVYNPTQQPIKLDILQAASYLTRPDALFLDLPAYVDNPLGRVHAGPGSRAAGDVLRGRRLGIWPPEVIIPPRQSHLLMNLPIPVGRRLNDTNPASNARSTLMRLRSDGPLYVANLAMFAGVNPDGTERMPTLEEWEQLLITGGFAGPRDHLPTPFNLSTGYSLATDRFAYGRVAGISLGSTWTGTLTDKPGLDYLTIPQMGQAFSYGLSTLYRGRLGTGQIQTAKMLARYTDTAYHAHGNYAVEYNLTLPLYNPTPQTRVVAISIQTPVKEDATQGGLVFFDSPERRVFFRGTVRIRYPDDSGRMQTQFTHIVQQRGQQGEPLVKLLMLSKSRKVVEVNLIYPADATPPQVLTVSTLYE